jgi:hypothetical protein
VVRANRAALEACAERALQDPARAAWAGRRISLLLLVEPTGRADAAIEDEALDASELGECLRRAIARMSFPAFRGDPVAAAVPLQLGRESP